MVIRLPYLVPEKTRQNNYITVADLHSKILDAPPGGPNSFNFMQFLGKFGKIVCWYPPPLEG